ncbi:Pkinase-domain-containing protein [Phanerochaete sordida]|uniref:mitogen-activated protein kinase kinase kinase n=1 Tax=Phanerochaete sordida TaxID=48140 RepID=A0A9P3LCS7_9APHY|nr:Pkinase-domain-containing protein [Phanerochaete sordida]
MAAVFMNGNSLHPPDDQPVSQASTPSSPNATFLLQQGQANLPSFSLSGAGYMDGQTQPSTPTSSTSSVPLDAPPGMAFPDYLRTWNDSHVSAWLSSIKCPHHSTVFRANDIRGDVLLELDQATLKEMGVFTVGDRIRIVAGVKALRQRCSSHSPSAGSIASRPRSQEHSRNGSVSSEGSYATRHAPRRLDNGRPAPLHLPPNTGSDSLPRLVRDGQDSARSTAPVRPLPQPNTSASNIHTPSSRPGLPPIPPPPRGQPPPPPSNARPAPRSLLPPSSQLSGRRTPTLSEAPAFNTSQPLPLPPGQSLPARPVRSPSPLQNSQLPNRNITRSPNEHGRNASLSGIASPAAPPKPQSRPSTGPSSHPYSLQHPSGSQSTLSPIAEAFRDPQRHTSSTPSPPTGSGAFRVGAGPFNRPNTPSASAPSLDDIRRKVVKFTVPEDGKSSMIAVWDCAGGAEIMERALKKLRGPEDIHNPPHVEIIDGGLTVDGWGVFSDMNSDGPRTPLSESQLLSICQASPDEPARENGLVLRYMKRTRTSPTSPYLAAFPKASSSTDTINDSLAPPADRMALQPGTKAYKRASSVSILSGLGVQIQDAPPEASAAPQESPSGPGSPSKKGKVRNFSGHRPPSELITTHLAEYFPFTEKKVLERTRRQSMMRGPTNRRDSIMSLNPRAQSRFSVSTQGSRTSNRNSVASRMSVASSLRERSPPPPMPEVSGSPPRVSISNEEGRPLEMSVAEKRMSRPHLLPPVAFPSESLAESMNLTGSRPGSRLSVASSKRMSYIQELRSKRDVSDTASMITVDEITAEVESRRETIGSKDSSDSEEWTAVEPSDADTKSIREIPEEEDEEEEEYEEEEDEEFDEEEEATEGTLTDEEGEPKAITSRGERTIKWIKGALIGSGSFGKVYLGMDAATGLLMAVKQVELPSQTAPNAERKQSMLNALEREIELLKELQHENIVQYLSSCVDEDHLNIFLEYVPGGSVTSLLRNYGAFEETLVRNWVRQILLGLNYLHSRDIIHRDIKGANMLVDNKGGIKISDFGISKKVEDNLMPGTRAHRPSLQGSVFWMAPEVVKQTAYTQKADIWSIGCLIVEMLTGEHPFPQLSQMQAIFKLGMSAKPTIPADISAEAENFLKLTFELDHETRPSAAELLKHPWIANLPAMGL